jgi:3-keto-5-aminohexanoate cleavage enzyme
VRLPHPLRPYPPLIVNAALTGMIPRRAQVPHVPVTAEAIVEDAVACHAAGAAIVHLHARDASEDPTWRRAAYAEFIPEIRRRCPGLVVCVTTSGCTFGAVEQRADVLELEGDAKPDMASLTLGSLNFRDGPSVNSLTTIRALAERMRERQIKAELEVFDTGMAGLALFMGGLVRTGLEDNPWWDHATREPATNAGLVHRIATLAELAGRRLATPEEARELLGLALVPSA